MRRRHADSPNWRTTCASIDGAANPVLETKITAAPARVQRARVGQRADGASARLRHGGDSAARRPPAEPTERVERQDRVAAALPPS
jgi:hypothetical protein